MTMPTDIKAQMEQMVLEHISKMPGVRDSYQTMYASAMGFYHAVDWSADSWILYILFAELVFFLFVVSTRKLWPVQMFCFFGTSLMLFLSERLNQYGHAHWSKFSTQDYFDPNGVFIGVVFCTPLLLTLATQLIMALYLTSHLLVDVKREELRRSRKAKNE